MGGMAFMSLLKPLHYETVHKKELNAAPYWCYNWNGIFNCFQLHFRFGA